MIPKMMFNPMFDEDEERQMVDDEETKFEEGVLRFVAHQVLQFKISKRESG